MIRHERDSIGSTMAALNETETAELRLALELMEQALGILDKIGLTIAAAELAQAIASASASVNRQ